MSVAAHIHKKLTTTSNIQSAVGTRIFPSVVPQGESFPCIVYNTTSIEPNDSKSGPSTEDRVNIQIDVYGSTYKQTNTIHERVRTALDRYRGTLEGTTFDYVFFIDYRDEGRDEQRDVFRLIQQYQIRVKR